MKSLAILTATAALAACAAPTSPSPSAQAPSGARAMAAADMGTNVVATDAGSCFRMSQVRNHTKGDNSTLYFDVGGRSVYRIGMSGACLAGHTNSDPLITKTVGGTDIVCRPLDLDVRIATTGGVGASPCIVKTITKLTPEQVAALPPKVKP